MYWREYAVQVGDKGTLIFYPMGHTRPPEEVSIKKVDISLSGERYYIFETLDGSTMFVYYESDFIAGNVIYHAHGATSPLLQALLSGNGTTPPRDISAVGLVNTALGGSHTAHSKCDVVKNQALGKEFYYCRDHKIEVDKP
jgi:hypothetical protein